MALTGMGWLGRTQRAALAPATPPAGIAVATHQEMNWGSWSVARTSASSVARPNDAPISAPFTGKLIATVRPRLLGPAAKSKTRRQLGDGRSVESRSGHSAHDVPHRGAQVGPTEPVAHVEGSLGDC